jgi:hypothetical protein
MLKILLSHKTYIGGTISDYQIGILLIFIWVRKLIEIYKILFLELAMT